MRKRRRCWTSLRRKNRRRSDFADRRHCEQSEAIQFLAAFWIATSGVGLLAMTMGWISTSGIFVLIWWTVLFAILPLWVKKPLNPLPGTSVGAPEHPYILRKMVITTIVSVALTGLIYILVFYGVLSFDFVHSG